ncbi:hypothetical protein B0H13DRAFT_1924604 [Mycena leptocephala]|nr:hypothetical protein B0H13DRAFT_1924604 [Mycena leptocephala]
MRGKASRGQQNNPVKITTGRQPQRRKDRSVAKDLDRFVEQVDKNFDPWDSDPKAHNSDSDTSDDTDHNADGLDIDDPLTRTGSQLTSSGRAPATKPLHPGRTSSKGKKRALPSDNVDVVQKRRGPIKFSNPPGPKRGHPSSLLPGSSPAKKEADAREKKRSTAEHKHVQGEEEKRKKKSEEKKARKEDKRLVKRRQSSPSQRLDARETEDQAAEVHMFGGVDELERWDDDSQLREDEGQGFTDIAMALSACLGSGFLILPSYFTRLAQQLRSMSSEDWTTSAQTLIDRANAEAFADPAKRNVSPFTDRSMFQHLIYYSRLIDPTAILFFHRDEDIHGREHWLLFRLDGKKRECIDPLDNHQKIYNSTQITADMDIVAAYLLGETMSKRMNVERLRKLRIQGVKQHLKEIWTSWRIGEDGLEEAALNALLKHFNAEVDGPLSSCIASRPQWITRAEEVVPATLDSSELLLNPETQSGKKALPQEVEDSVASDGETMSHEQALTAMKQMADAFCLNLAANHDKLKGLSGPLFLGHLYRVSNLDGWIPGDVINEWAKHLDINVSQPDTKVLETGFFNQLRNNCRLKHGKKLEDWWQFFIRGTRKWFKMHETRAIVMPIHVPSHWICSFVDFDNHYLAIFDSWPKSVPDNDWKRSDHAHIIELIKEWLQRLFIILESAIDWKEWRIDPCPKNQPYQTNGFDCGPHSCFMMSLLSCRQTNDIGHTNQVITSRTVQKFRVPIEAGENEEVGNDSDQPIEVQPMSENDSASEVSSRSSLTTIPSSDHIPPPVMPRRSTRTVKKI